ncbi:MAG: Rqc2 family fibronectin-binding protein [Oscillospiraceae bacterium]|jgi:predicted ribosome quality control (RQC) complex YloA/Tae2 family protein
MSLDAAMIRCTVGEISRTAAGMKVMKVTMPARDEVVLSLRSRDDARRLLLCARPGSARVQLTSQDPENPAVPPSFCMLLRKYIGGGRIESVECLDSERVVFIRFSNISETGDIINPMLSVELMGRYSNVILVGDDGNIIDAMRRISDGTSTKREILPGIPFTYPTPQEGKKPFFSTADEEIADTVCRSSRPLSSALLSSISGIGPLVCREISHRTASSDPEASSLSGDQKMKLCSVIRRVKSAADTDPELNIVYDEDGRALEFSFIELTQYDASLKRERFDSPSSMLDSFFSARDADERRKTRSHNLRHQVSTILERTIRKNEARRAEYETSDKAAQKKLYGELLTANQWKMKKGADSVEVQNYYDGSIVRIPLDPMLSPNANAQKYYKEYRKLTTAHRVLGDLIKSGAEEEEYLKSVLYEVDSASTEDDFISITEELREAGYLRRQKGKPQKRHSAEKFLRYKSGGGFTILAGKSNTSNDRLTLHTADKRDIWFHVKGAPGSHVILRLEGRSPGEGDLEDAASIAAYHSSLRGNRIEVDYTEVKNVHKSPGARAGMVTYKNQQTCVVTPDPEKIEKMRVTQ